MLSDFTEGRLRKQDKLYFLFDCSNHAIGVVYGFIQLTPGENAYWQCYAEEHF
jgi:hypothetical protein